MKILFVFLLVLILSVPYYSQTEIQPEQNLMGFLPKFFIDALNYKSDEAGKTRVDVYVEVPFLGIQFLKSNQGFTATYSVTLSFFDDEKKNLIVEKTWNESVNSKTFEGTVSKNSYFLSMKSFNLVPRTYSLRCEVIDNDSKKNYVREDDVVVRSISGPMDISDVLLVSKPRIINGEEKVFPNISKNVAAQKEGISMYYEVYSDSARKTTVDYSIINGKKENIFSQNDTESFKPGKNIVQYTLSNTEMDMGLYQLSVQLKKNNGAIAAKTDKMFFSRWAGMPSAIKDLDKAVDEMTYIATPKEMGYVKDASDEKEKSKRFVEFWQKKDPSPSTDENEVFDEYYRRVTYANEHFKHYQEGWRTDMGMVYITLGVPSNIERHPFEFDSKPYEIWDYYDINKRFIFFDETGFGDYRLTQQPYGNWWKYRQ